MNQLGKIKDWAADDRPREKLSEKGPAALSNAELLAILIHSGTRQHSALELARMVLAQVDNNLSDLGRLSVTELKRTKGIGSVRALTIAAALELGRRRQGPAQVQRTLIRSGEDAAQIVLPLLTDLNHEAFCVLYLNQANLLLRHEIISNGGMTGTVADVRIILKNSLLNNANQLIVAHNHPSGSLTPSQADKLLTAKLREAAALMDIRLLDHLIIGAGQYYSLQEEGFLA
jgi:DNA repair protein RadC